MSLLTGGGGEEEGGGGEEVCLPPQERKRGGRSKKGKKKVRRVARLAEVSLSSPVQDNMQVVEEILHNTLQQHGNMVISDFPTVSWCIVL